MAKKYIATNVVDYIFKSDKIQLLSEKDGKVFKKFLVNGYSHCRKNHKTSNKTKNRLYNSTLNIPKNDVCQ